MTTDTWEHEEFSALVIDNDTTAAEFKLATRQALENTLSEFEFHGYLIEVKDAIEVIDFLEEGRTYH